MHQRIESVTRAVVDRSRDARAAYLRRLASAADRPRRQDLSCTNLAHAWAAAPAGDKLRLRQMQQPNLAIVSAYNDMLSAHQPLEGYPAILKTAARRAGATAQFAGGVPAMCDGVTQGQQGMELSLFSRDVIAMSTAVALSHQMFDAALYLGVCDKIVPGLLIGALHFGHLPAIFVPAGPMPSGLENKEKARLRQLHAEGKLDRDALLEAEEKSYHSAGTCTFYGTANSNQMLMEVMGLHLPGAAFVTPGTPLREALTAAAATRAAAITALGADYLPVGRIIDERAIVNGIVGLMATGGSTNHAIHLVAIARAAGIHIDWSDFDAISAVVPLLARVYPNGQADVNHFHAAGGMGLLIRSLLDLGLLHEDVTTIMGHGLRSYTREPWLDEDVLAWREAPKSSLDPSVVAHVEAPFQVDGGLRLLQGRLGRGIIKVSAVAPERRIVMAPAVVFDDPDDLTRAFQRGDLDRDFVAVVRFQGPRANGMPELHKLMPPLGVLQDRGHKVALVTDGRLSGASGKVPAAIHVTPEASLGGPLAKVRDGDVLLLDAETGTLEVHVDAATWAAREAAILTPRDDEFGCGRALFAGFRSLATSAEEGAMSFGLA